MLLWRPLQRYLYTYRRAPFDRTLRVVRYGMLVDIGVEECGPGKN